MAGIVRKPSLCERPHSGYECVAPKDSYEPRPTAVHGAEYGQLQTFPPIPKYMNPRRVHELMRANFPAFDAAKMDWVNVVDEQGTLMNERAYAIIAEPFLRRGIIEVLVQVQRKTGDLLPVAQLTTYLAGHLRLNEIRIADRQFGSFAVLSLSGVAVQWAKP